MQDTIEKREAFSKDLLTRMVDNFLKHAKWQVEGEYYDMLAQDAWDIARTAFKLAEIKHVVWQHKSKEVGNDNS